MKAARNQCVRHDAANVPVDPNVALRNLLVARTHVCIQNDGYVEDKEWILLNTMRQAGGRDGASGGARLKPKHRSPVGKPHGYEERMRCGRVNTRR